MKYEKKNRFNENYYEFKGEEQDDLAVPNIKLLESNKTFKS